MSALKSEIREDSAYKEAYQLVTVEQLLARDGSLLLQPFWPSKAQVEFQEAESTASLEMDVQQSRHHYGI